jgi:hypothetical protein
MSSIVIAGDTSGSVTLQAPAVAGTTVITLPSTSTTLVSSQWTTSGSQVYFTGSIGVGTSAINSWYSDNKAIDMPAGSVFSYSTTNQFIGQNTFVNASGTQVAKNTGASALYGQSAGIHQFASAPSVSANSTQTFTTLLEFSKGKTLALESATSVSGTGISFPSTQSASSDANTLDDYEEGTWTPTVTFSGTSGSGTGVTYSSQTGRYTKIGRAVVCTGEFVLTNKGSGSGVIRITGWPFTNGVERAAITFGNVNLVTHTGFINAYLEGNQTYTNCQSTDIYGAMTYLYGGNCSNTTHLQFTVTFQV